MSPKPAFSTQRRPQNASSNHVAGFGVTRPRAPMLRTVTASGSAIFGVQGISTNVDGPTWAGPPRRTKVTKEATWGSGVGGVAVPISMRSRLASASRPCATTVKPRCSSSRVSAGSAGPGAVASTTSLGQSR